MSFFCTCFLMYCEKLHALVRFLNAFFTCILDQVSLSCTVPYNVTPGSNIKVTRIKDMITNQRLLNKFSLSAPYTVWRTVWRIYILMIGCKGFKGTFN